MVMLPQAVNVADIPDDDFEPIPAGTYDALITESDMKATAAGDGAYLELKIEIQGPDCKGRVLFERLNLQNKNEKAVEIAYKTLKKICEAIGKTSIKDSVELHNKRFKIAVEIEKGKPYADKTTGEQKEGRDQNRIKKYMPFDAVQVVQNNGAGAAAVSSAAPASTAAANVPPWKR